MPVYRLSDTGVRFPDPSAAEEDGLLAVGGDLSVKRLVAAYSLGIFPWYSAGCPLLWWSPDPRCILLPEEFHLPKSLRRVLKSGLFSFSLDRAFPEVIRACAGPRAKATDTWLTPEMIAAYIDLHRLGFAHSVEAWRGSVLVGGLYGVALGRVFFGESMFRVEPDASKAALVRLIAELEARSFVLLDCQQVTGHMLRFGAKPVPRKEFMRFLSQGLAGSWERGRWTLAS
ncbi:MAG: leucyl/phenylalanyl-tRNA--protein transferase [Desulfovibrio sp.]|jgi:leucyl/phenylalanyl-tRNA--protein transferase|nr:leucyl/phenylalanyl-tRNA--protein transferase [Desulfovibrio sp.]